MALSHPLPEAKLDRYVAIPSVSTEGARGHDMGPHTQWQWGVHWVWTPTATEYVGVCVSGLFLLVFWVPYYNSQSFHKESNLFSVNFLSLLQVRTWANGKDRESHTALSELYRKKSVLIRKTMSFEDGKYRSKNLKKIFSPLLVLLSFLGTTILLHLRVLVKILLYF